MPDKKTSLIILLLLVCMSVSQAQNDYPYTEHNNTYRYIREDKNRIVFPGDSSSFEQFYSKLDSLILFGEKKIRILHFGGSHIQAGIYSGQCRKKLQNLFPGLNGGRGLVFPFGMSKTYTPKSYRFKWTGKWETCRNVEHKDCELGVAGIKASTKDCTASIYLKLNPSYQNYAINTIKILHKNTSDSYKIRLALDSSEYTLSEYPEKSCTVFKTKQARQSFKFNILKTDTSQKEFTLYGIVLEDDFQGIVYSDAGISGAGLYSFLKCNLFDSQLELLNPDLVIVSLGTNDTYGKNFKPQRFKQNYIQFLERIKQSLPNTAILLTVPNDCYYRKRDPLPFTEDAETVILQLAKEYNCGVWDFYRIMGGYNSSYLWHKDKLMQHDLIHFTKKGYIIKGNLFFNALIRSYDAHIKR